MQLYREISNCRACGSARLETVLDLGNLAVSDFPALASEQEDRAPLTLVVCLDCSLVQLRHTVERDRLYRDYWYRSGTNESMVASLRDVVDDAVRRVGLRDDEAVLDIGANDGTMLRLFPAGAYRYGFEPSNLAGEAREGTDGIFRDYFPPAWPAFRQFKVITSIAMFYDLEEPGAFVKAIKDWLHPRGVWLVQFQDLAAMLGCNGFDNICHEHLTYWGQDAFLALLAQHGLCVEDVTYNQTNGGSVRYAIRHGKQRIAAPSYGDVFAQAWALAEFGRKVETLKERTRVMLQRIRAAGQTVLGYGASTKGNTTLQYYGITADLLPAIAERNPDKWGKVTAGTHIPIISEQEMRERRPDYLFVLPWHFIDGFVQREAAFLAGGGRFIVPLPELRVVGGEGICQSTADARSDSVLAATG